MTSDLIVRLPNHLGDACMSLPTLDLLAARGSTLMLVGRGWASDLFAAYPWPVLTLPRDRHERVQALRARCKPGTAALLLTNSFGSALDFRLAGLRSIGYRTELRRPLLAQAIAVPTRWRQTEPPMHMVEYYYELARAMLDDIPPVPRSLSLRLSAAAIERANQMLQAAGVGRTYVMLCPVAIGLHRGKVKAWSGFGALCTGLLAKGRQVVACPGPGERAAVQQSVPGATLLPETDVGTFAALLVASRLVVANDSGAAHVAAAVGARLVTILGVTDARRTGPWSPRALGVGRNGAWPGLDEVAAVVDRQLDAP